MNNLKLFLLLLVSLCFLSFFDPISVSEQRLGQIISLISLLIVFAHFYHQLFIKSNSIKSQISDSLVIPINLLIISVSFSMFPAYLYHNQTIFSSFLALKDFYVLFLYFILFRYNYSYKQVLNLCLLLFFITLLIFVVDYRTFPNTYFSWRSEERRDAFTILFKGQGFTLLGTFFFLALSFRSGKFYFLIFYILGFCFLNFFNASRMMTLALIMGTLFMLFFYRKAIKKYFFYAFPILIAGLIIGIYFLKSYIYGLFILTENQGLSSHSIRFEAMRYFADSFQTNGLTKVFGNGFPYWKGIYQDSFIKGQILGYFTSDIGLVGFWVYFGILGVISWVLIFKKIFMNTTNDQNVFIKPYFIYLLVTIFTGYALFDPGYMISTIFCLFLFDKSKQESITFRN
jgi:hypothetical protein